MDGWVWSNGGIILMDGWVWSNGGMLLTGENWTVLGEKHYTAWVVDGWMSMERCWNDTDRGKLKCWERNVFQCHFASHKYHMDCTGIEPEPPRWETGNLPPQPFFNTKFNNYYIAIFISYRIGNAFCFYLPYCTNSVISFHSRETINYT